MVKQSADVHESVKDVNILLGTQLDQFGAQFSRKPIRSTPLEEMGPEILIRRLQQIDACWLT